MGVTQAPLPMGCRSPSLDSEQGPHEDTSVGVTLVFDKLLGVGNAVRALGRIKCNVLECNKRE